MHLQVDRSTSKLHIRKPEESPQSCNLLFCQGSKRKHASNTCCVGYGIEREGVAILLFLDSCSWLLVSNYLGWLHSGYALTIGLLSHSSQRSLWHFHKKTGFSEIAQILVSLSSGDYLLEIFHLLVCKTVTFV